MNSIASKGIDVSWYQNQGKSVSIPWAKLKADGITWAYIRSSCGLAVDVECKKNITEAHAAGIEWIGCYHFMHEDEPSLQVAVIKKAIAGVDGMVNLPFAIDAESRPSKGIKAYVDLILDFESKLIADDDMGFPVLYTYESMLRTIEQAKCAQAIEHMPVWVAKYPGANLARGIPKEGNWRVYAWQYDGDGGEKMPNGVDCDYNFSDRTGYEISRFRDGFTASKCNT